MRRPWTFCTIQIVDVRSVWVTDRNIRDVDFIVTGAQQNNFNKFTTLFIRSFENGFFLLLFFFRSADNPFEWITHALASMQLAVECVKQIRMTTMVRSSINGES